MASIRKMQCGDIKQASKMTEEIMLDFWEKYEKDYYPKKALDFDISVHSPKYYRASLSEETNFAFVAEENGGIVGIAMGRLVGESGLVRLGEIGVRSNHQETGMGKVLLEKVIKHCVAESCQKSRFASLVSYSESDLKCGFVPEAYLHKEWWNVNFIIMSKRL